jgi:hypothetical protein
VLAAQRAPLAQRPRPQDRRQRLGVDLPARPARTAETKLCAAARDPAASGPDPAAHGPTSAPARSSAWKRVLRDAGIKLSSVASSSYSKSARAMLEALLSGVTDPEQLAELSKGRMRAKIPQLREALPQPLQDRAPRDHGRPVARAHRRARPSAAEPDRANRTGPCSPRPRRRAAVHDPQAFKPRPPRS